MTRWSVNEKSGSPATPTRRGVAVASTGSATIHAHSPNNPPNNPRSAPRVPCPTDTLPSAERPSSAVVIRERLMCWSVRCRAAGALHVRSCDMTVELHAALRDLATCNAMRALRDHVMPCAPCSSSRHAMPCAPNALRALFGLCET